MQKRKIVIESAKGIGKNRQIYLEKIVTNRRELKRCLNCGRLLVKWLLNQDCTKDLKDLYTFCTRDYSTSYGNSLYLTNAKKDYEIIISVDPVH